MAPRKIIIDTDPGGDDAVAILLALASPAELTVLGLTAVAGNVPLAQSERNARAICELAARPETPVYAGCGRPLSREPLAARSVLGATGLGRLILPEPQIRPQKAHAVDFLVEALFENDPGTVTLCALGPLTNVAMALVKEPLIAERIQELVIMGGAYFAQGNQSPVAEFNILSDPHAAKIVLESGAEITMMPLDVTHKALGTPERIERFRRLGNRCGAAIAELLSLAAERANGRFAGKGSPLHDPCVMAYLLRPDLFRGRRVNVSVETKSALSLGMTVVDWWSVTGRPPNALWMAEIEADLLYDLLVEHASRLP